MRKRKPHEYNRGLFTSLQNLIRSRYLWFLLIFILFTLVLLHVINPYLSRDSLTQLSHISELVLSEPRGSLERKLAAETEYELYKYETSFQNSRCSVSNSVSSSVSGKLAWLTLVRDDDLSVVQAVVLSHMLGKLSCVTEKLAMLHNTSDGVRDSLRKAGFKIIKLPDLSCDGLNSDHVILGAWNLTQYDKIVYLDTATFPVMSVDSLFDTIQLGKISSPYRSGPGVVDISFSGRMFGFKPQTDTYNRLLKEFKNRRQYECQDVTSFLWYFFTKNESWVKLSYGYNVRNDRYFPMKSYNFAEVSRLGYVWEWEGKPTRQQAEKMDKPLFNLEDLYAFWWKMLYEGLEEAELWHWWHYESDIYRKFLHSDPVRDFRAVDIY